MTNYLKLLKIFIQTTEITSTEKKRSKHFYTLMGTAIVLLIMLPAGALVGIITYALTLGVLANGGDTQASVMILHIISILSAVFGFNVIINIFYFSNDIENLLPLPLRPHEIIASKFTYSLLSENIMEFILIVGACVGFMAAGGWSVFGVVTSVVGIATLPVIPLAYCGIASVIFMYFTHSVKNRDFLNKITGVGTAILIVGALVSLVCVSGLNADSIAASLSGDDNGFLNIMNIIFPHIPLMMKSIYNNSPVELLLYILVNAAFVAVFLLISSKMYIKGVSDVNTSKNKQSKSLTEKAVASSVEKGIFASYLKKEFIVLFRTPPFFMDCIAINLLWPVFLVVIVILQGQTNFLSGVLTPYLAGDENSALYITLAFVAVSVLVTAINSIASAAITREGKHFEFMRYIPVKLQTQLNVKAAASIIISGVGMLLYIIAFNIYCLFCGAQFDVTLFVLMPILHTVLAILSVVFVTYLGIYMDTINPKLVWDDEINALRGNYNIFINTAVVMVIAAVICGGSLALVWLTNIAPIIISLALVALMAVLCIISYRMCMGKGVNNLESIE